MARLARIVIPKLPHHVTQRGNRRQDVFFSDADYRQYIKLLTHHAREAGTEIWAYCLMPNHVHLIAMPHFEDGLSKAVGKCHQRYARAINRQYDWRGHLWEQRYSSIPMDERHLLMAARYVELNPVRAGLASSPGRYVWRSAFSHLQSCVDDLSVQSPLNNLVDNWCSFLAEGIPDDTLSYFIQLEKSGYPAGDECFVSNLEAQFGLSLRPRKRGPKPKP